MAIVNDSIITLSELNAASSISMDELKNISSPKKKKMVTEVRSKALDQLIERKLVEQASNKTGISVSEREIDNAIDDVKKENNLTHDTLLTALAANGLTYKEYRNQLKDQIRQMKFMGKEFRSKITISDEDIEAYYIQNRERFYEPIRFRFYHIFLAMPPNATIAQRQYIEQIAKEILLKIWNGEDFVTLTLKYSQGPSPENGGDIGFLKAGEIDPSIEKAVLGLNAGETSSVIRSKIGLHIIKLLEKKEKEVRPLEAVKEDIKNILYRNIVDERYKLWLEEQKSTAHIEVRL
ncbi:MAG: peptidylprolyl isomerase [Deltaproteobacteria bacterium]|nr:peptidylprolyl isomerase [Deltaproteobacteria bacterium]